jgi:hypothetical protein
MKYVYLIRSEESGMYKVGVSKHPKKRIKQLQTGNGEELTLIESFPSNFPHKVETALHNGYAPDKKRGEWFMLGIEQEFNFISDCAKIEQNIKYLIMEGNEFI